MIWLLRFAPQPRIPLTPNQRFWREAPAGLAEKGWTLKEVSERSGIAYSTVKNYAQSPGLAMVDYTALQKLARIFDVMVDDLVEVLEE